MGAGWTESRVNLLTMMWIGGKSAGEIAKHFGDVTRNAVIGKAHRLGLNRSHPRLNPTKPVMVATPSISVPLKRPATVRKSTKVAAPRAVKPVYVDVTKAPDARLIPIGEIRDGECKFAVEGPPFLFCGAATGSHDESWCPYHRSIVFLTPAARKAEIKTMRAAGAMFKGPKTILWGGWE